MATSRCTGYYTTNPNAKPGWEMCIGIDYTNYADKKVKVPDIKDVIFNPPATIVLWADGTKTVVKCQEDKDEYSKEVGLAMCICKKVYRNKGNYNNVFKKFIKEY